MRQIREQVQPFQDTAENGKRAKTGFRGWLRFCRLYLFRGTAAKFMRE
jgi:hypothetical protein